MARLRSGGGIGSASALGVEPRFDVGNSVAAVATNLDVPRAEASVGPLVKRAMGDAEVVGRLHRVPQPFTGLLRRAHRYT